MRPDHFEILVNPRLPVVRIRSIAGLVRERGSFLTRRVQFWGRLRVCLAVYFPHRPELPANPMEGRPFT
jgi:hypothetical protein